MLDLGIDRRLFKRIYLVGTIKLCFGIFNKVFNKEHLKSAQGEPNFKHQTYFCI